MYEENGQIHSVEDGEYICQKWNGSEFETLKIGQSAKQSNVEITGVENAPWRKFMRTVNLLQMITIMARRGECLVNCFTAKNVIW